MSRFDDASARDPESVARLSRAFARSLTVADIAEPLLSIDENQSEESVRDIFLKQTKRVLGVRRDGAVVGWILVSDLHDGSLAGDMRAFSDDDFIDETASLDDVLERLAIREWLFLKWLGAIAGVVGRADLQKAPVRMWLFGAITVLDANMTWAVDALYPGDSWRDRISAGRLEKAEALFAERVRTGSGCRLLDCLQIKDKTDILAKERTHLNALSFSSRNEADRFFKDLQNLRNQLAHSQELEGPHIATATQLASYVHQILKAEGSRRLVELSRISGQVTSGSPDQSTP